MIRNQIWRVSRFVIVATGLTTVLSNTDIMISGWQVKRIIAIFILNEINMFIFSNQRVIHSVFIIWLFLKEFKRFAWEII
jgi:hypothetical protein